MNNKADTFLELAESLSKYRRAELKDNNSETLIEELYVDPLDNDLILKSMLQNNTTLLIGRKGTGKSTIINRFQHEIRKSDKQLSLYIDVKSLFEQAKKSSMSSQKFNESLSKEDKEKLILYTSFIQKVIEELKKEIKKDIFKNRITKFFSKKGLTELEFKKQLDALFENIEKPQFQDITSIKQESNNHSDTSKQESNISAGASTSKMETSAKESKLDENITSSEFTEILGRYFNIIEFMNELKELLLKLPIENVFICLDDMSEIDKDSMEIFTEFIVAPLNNLSDEYFKFKISLYPSRDYLPSIDRQKVKTFNLDYYDLYSVGNSSKIEESAIKYTKKLIEKRFNHYYGEDVQLSDFFSISATMTIDDYYKLLFQVSSNVPRIIGKILDISLQKTNSLETKISKKIIQESAKQHYISDIEYVLTKSEYIEYKSYDENFEQFHLLELLNNIIEKAIANKKHIGTATSQIFEKYTTNTAPSNYIHITEDKENILKTLEFNFFITKYSKQQNKNSEESSVFSLNYGLCMKNNIIFDNGSDRKFRIERTFDCNKLIDEWMNNSKELICSNCNTKYPLEQKDVFIKFNMLCTNCQGKVVLRPVVTSDIEQQIDSRVKIPQKEYDILNALNNKSNLRAKELGDELDRTHQSITHSISSKNSKIKKYSFILREEKNAKAYFKLSEKGTLYVREGII